FNQNKVHLAAPVGIHVRVAVGRKQHSLRLNSDADETDRVGLKLLPNSSLPGRETNPKDLNCGSFRPAHIQGAAISSPLDREVSGVQTPNRNRFTSSHRIQVEFPPGPRAAICFPSGETKTARIPSAVRGRGLPPSISWI